MSEYLIKGETLESMADKIRILNGVEGALTTAQMDENLGEANADVSTQANLIAQISSALEGKAGGGSGKKTITVTINNLMQHGTFVYCDKTGSIVTVSGSTVTSEVLGGMVFYSMNDGVTVRPTGNYKKISIFNNEAYCFFEDGCSIRFDLDAPI